MINIVATIVSVLLCYIAGSIPTGYIMVKSLKGIDVRTVGSRNMGATNVGRVLGKKFFFIVLVLDALKGFVPVLLVKYLSVKYGFYMDIALLAAAAVVIGHSFPLFLNFKGGKGVATGLGVFLALAPAAVAIALGVFIVLVLLFRMISLGSIVASVVLSVAVFFLYRWEGLWVFTWVLTLFVIYRHKANIRRILAGTENKINLGK